MKTENETNKEYETLKSFLEKEIEDIGKRLGELKSKIKEDDFKSLEEELDERRETLKALQEEDDSQLFLLRRELGTLKGNVEARAIRPRWWKRIPGPAWIVIITLPLVLYFAVLSVMQWQSQSVINSYATQTVAAEQAAVSMETETPAP